MRDLEAAGEELLCAARELERMLDRGVDPDEVALAVDHRERAFRRFEAACRLPLAGKARQDARTFARRVLEIDSRIADLVSAWRASFRADRAGISALQRANRQTRSVGSDPRFVSRRV